MFETIVRIFNGISISIYLLMNLDTSEERYVKENVENEIYILTS